tara:strand:- start:899 stop:1786 length:888 start_codon:yes stop_codon:yes gene_type:complete
MMMRKNTSKTSTARGAVTGVRAAALFPGSLASIAAVAGAGALALACGDFPGITLASAVRLGMYLYANPTHSAARQPYGAFSSDCIDSGAAQAAAPAVPDADVLGTTFFGGWNPLLANAVDGKKEEEDLVPRDADDQDELEGIFFPAVGALTREKRATSAPITCTKSNTGHVSPGTTDSFALLQLDEQESRADELAGNAHLQTMHTQSEYQMIGRTHPSRSSHHRGNAALTHTPQIYIVLSFLPSKASKLLISLAVAVTFGTIFTGAVVKEKTMFLCGLCTQHGAETTRTASAGQV